MSVSMRPFIPRNSPRDGLIFLTAALIGHLKECLLVLKHSARATFNFRPDAPRCMFHMLMVLVFSMSMAMIMSILLMPFFLLYLAIVILTWMKRSVAN